MLDIQQSIKVKNGKPLVSSRDIAIVFKRKHKTVLNAIENANEHLEPEFSRHNIMPTYYKDDQKRQQPEILLTRAGFSVVALGFTGKKAIKFRQKYVEADMINRIVTGMTAKQLRVQRNIPDKDFTRDHLSPEEINFIEKLQKYNTILLEQDHDYQGRKAALQYYFNKLTRRALAS